eukprot:14663-Hanusia_phi.AAC.5
MYTKNSLTATTADGQEKMQVERRRGRAVRAKLHSTGDIHARLPAAENPNLSFDPPVAEPRHQESRKENLHLRRPVPKPSPGDRASPTSRRLEDLGDSAS